ncbi:uncharacterized protein RAG0_00905 [Rhynchosporium agropyri]|uniref:Uncharacterized protein n=1 Tax=Rhynchosporium agropyri TaxID=914238 RepID=A0A1E1JUG5_9HELO|nr:uncharacterized protein RAG0_00905 [Rhynchosporium agropyri]
MCDSGASSPDIPEDGPHQPSDSSLDLGTGEPVPINTPSESDVEMMPTQPEPHIKKEIYATPSIVSIGPSVTIDLTKDSDETSCCIDLTESSDENDPAILTSSEVYDPKPIKEESSPPSKKKRKRMHEGASTNRHGEDDVDHTEQSVEDDDEVSTPSDITGHRKYIDPTECGDDYSDEDDDEFPAPSEIADRKVIKEEPPSPPEIQSVLIPKDDSGNVDYSLFVDKGSNYAVTEDEDEYSDIEESLAMQNSKKSCNDKLSITQRRGNIWKKQRLDKIEEVTKKYIASKKHTKIPRAHAKDFDAGQFFDDLLGSGDPTSGDNLDDSLQLRGNTRDGVWKDLQAKYPHTHTKEMKAENSKLVREAATLGCNKVKRMKHGWLLQGMKSLLRNHQLSCVLWMVKRDCASEKPNGGMVADVMSLGKTVQCLGLIVTNPQIPDLAITKATLWIVPASLKGQTWLELNEHTSDLGDTSMVYESKRMDNSMSRMSKSDVVITTYGELVKSLPQPDPDTIRRWKKEDQDIGDMTLQWTKENMEGAGMLHQVQWHRIIIDECHHIKNPETRLFRAALFLTGECRWFLSGTPVVNCYEEFHPMLRFVEEPFTKDLSLQQFQRRYCDVSDIGSCRALNIVLTGIILRRTLKGKILGIPIIKLKPTHREIREVKRYLPERLLYRIIHDRFRELLNQSFEDGDEQKHLNTLLAQLTRLRQLIASPDLIARQIMVVLGSKGMRAFMKKLKDTRFAAKAKPQSRILEARLKRWLVAKKADAYQAVTKEDICAVCKQPDEHLFVLKKCGCILCGGCIGNNHDFDVHNNGDERGQCPSCQRSYIVGSGIREHASIEVPNKDKSKHKTKWPLEWLKDCDEDDDEEVLPTAKLRGTVLKIKVWLKEAPLDKIVVFTQFRFFAILVGIMLELKKVKFIYYTGDMPNTDRSDAVKHMEGDPTIQVMIADLKCGGTGLNFQFANRGIITDIWWNTCIDEQALGRFQRLGQLKRVHFVRIVVTRTVESKLIKLQDKKKKNSANVIQDHDLDEAELADVLGYLDGELDEEPDTSDDEDDDVYGDDGF